jgi:hypothetical protein
MHVATRPTAIRSAVCRGTARSAATERVRDIPFVYACAALPVFPRVLPPKCLEKLLHHATVGCLKDSKEKPFNLGVSPDMFDSASATATDNNKSSVKL